MNTMVGCSQTRRLIDEADHPESLSFEASRHVASCPDCGSFAGERARLRSLVASGSRVTVPMNFDAVLKARLADAKARTPFAWLGPAGYLRLGAATAGLVVMAFAAQYAGLFRGDNSAPGQETAVIVPTRPPSTQPPGDIARDPAPAATTVGNNSAPQFARVNRGLAGAGRVGVPVDIPREDYFHEDGGVALVRGPDGEGEVSLPMVSVGAQSLVYASAGAGRRTPRTLGTSF